MNFLAWCCQAWIVEKVDSILRETRRRPLIYKTEMHFINFPDFYKPVFGGGGAEDKVGRWRRHRQPTYFAMVREPLDWFISRFNFLRSSR